MEPLVRFEALWSPSPVPLPHHHHHHHHHHRHHHHHYHCHCHRHHHHPHQFCSHHGGHHHHHCNSLHPQLSTGLPPLAPQNKEPVASSYPSQKDLSLEANFHQGSSVSPGDLVSAEQGYDGFEEAEEEEDPVFVLADEWREFFARSEAKRRLEKQQAKRKEKR